MIVYAVFDGYDDPPMLFATRELAEQHIKPTTRKLYAMACDPSTEMMSGWGGREWRVKHYSEMGWEAFWAGERDKGVQELEVITE